MDAESSQAAKHARSSAGDPVEVEDAEPASGSKETRAEQIIAKNARLAAKRKEVAESTPSGACVPYVDSRGWCLQVQGANACANSASGPAFA